MPKMIIAQPILHVVKASLICPCDQATWILLLLTDAREGHYKSHWKTDHGCPTGADQGIHKGQLLWKREESAVHAATTCQSTNPPTFTPACVILRHPRTGETHFIPSCTGHAEFGANLSAGDKFSGHQRQCPTGSISAHSSCKDALMGWFGG